MTTTDTIAVDPSNADAYRAWDGDDGDYWAENEAIFDDSVARYDRPFLDAAAIAPADHVLDIGCGNGLPTRQAARLAPQGSVLGVDLSTRMIERARERAAEEGLANTRFLQADAQIHPFEPGSFDVAVSRTGAMFFGDPVAAFTNIARALRPSGRLALLAWQPVAGNRWIRDFMAALAAGRDLSGTEDLPVYRFEPPPDAPGPFSLADPDRTRATLTAAGFADITFDGVEELMYFGPDAEAAYRFVGNLGVIKFLLGGLADRSRALDALRATIDAHETSEGVLYPSAAWIITARRN